MFTLDSVKSILETEFDITMKLDKGYFDSLRGDNDVLDSVAIYDYGEKFGLFITKRGLGRSQLELAYFEITDENQLRQFIEQSKKVLAFYDTI